MQESVEYVYHPPLRTMHRTVQKSCQVTCHYRTTQGEHETAANKANWPLTFEPTSTTQKKNWEECSVPYCRHMQVNSILQVHLQPPNTPARAIDIFTTISRGHTTAVYTSLPEPHNNPTDNYTSWPSKP